MVNIYFNKRLGLYLPNSAPQTKGYSEAGASRIRRALKGFMPNSGSPNEDINYNNYTLRQRSRMLYMASPVATAAINTNRTKVIGVGLTLKSTIDRDLLGMTQEAAKEWQTKAEAEFNLWSRKKQNCDALGVNNFEGMQQLAMKSWLMSGDVFALIKRYPSTTLSPYTMRLHVIEADRISTPVEYGGGIVTSIYSEGCVPDGKPGAGHKIYDGVEIDDYGRIVAYYICNVYPNEFTSKIPSWQRVEVYGKRTGLPNILHIMDSERPDQYRGVPYLAQVIEPLLQLRRYTEAELVAALVQSFFSAWIVTQDNPTDILFNEVGVGEIEGYQSTNEENISDSPNEYEMGPGTVTQLKKGEDIKFGNPNIPTAGFETFVKTLCRLVGSALELPYDVLIKEFNSSYSASRGALLEAWEAFRMRRAWFVDDFCQPVYEAFLAEAVALGRIKAPGFFDDPLIREAWCGARWIGPVQGSLDPLKEVKAYTLQIQQGLRTREQVTREIGGGDFTANAEQLEQENKLMQKTGYGAMSSEIDPNTPDEPDISEPKEEGNNL